MASEYRIFIGNLPPNVRSREIEDIFYKYGNITRVDVKCGPQGSAYAFLDFEDPRDAEDAVEERNGFNFAGYKLRVEFSHRGARAGGYRDRGRRFRNVYRRTDYRLYVSGLPPSGSWQDLKDHMRFAGDVCFADVYKDGTGVVEFLRYEDMKFALKKLDDSKFRSHEGETSYIHVWEDYRSAGRSRSRSRSRSSSPVSRKYSRSRSRSRSDSYERR